MHAFEVKGVGVGSVGLCKGGLCVLCEDVVRVHGVHVVERRCVIEKLREQPMLCLLVLKCLRSESRDLLPTFSHTFSFCSPSPQWANDGV